MAFEWNATHVSCDVAGNGFLFVLLLLSQPNVAQQSAPYGARISAVAGLCVRHFKQLKPMCGDEIDRQFICNQYYKLDALHNREMILMLHFMKIQYI